jgi:biotin carboxyl carrier protein
MRYIARINDQTITVDIEEAGGQCTLSVDGQPVTASLCKVTDPYLYSLILDGASYEVFAEPTGNDYAIVIDGERYLVSVNDERHIRLAQVEKRAVHRRGDMVVKAPMPGLVKDVLIQPGDSVTRGQPLIILEAMKMENELRAFEAGTVKAVQVAPGEKVDQGQVLAVIG